MADALDGWLPDIFPAVRPFVSTSIEGGLKWFNEIESNLKDARFGIVCLTLESYQKPWVNFEAGALLTAFNKDKKDNRVCPYYLDGEEADYQAPLGLLHMKKADKDGTLGLLRSISSVLTECNLPTHDVVRLVKHFETWWEALEVKLKAIPPPADGETKPEVRSTDDMIREVLGILRQQPAPVAPRKPKRRDLEQACRLAAHRIRKLEDAGLTLENALEQALDIYELEEIDENYDKIVAYYQQLPPVDVPKES